MTEREALKLALKALQKIYIATEHEEYIRVWWPACEQAISAIKEALAQPEQEYHAVNAVHKGQQCYVKAQPEQEPCCYGGIAHDCHAGDGCRIAERIKAAQAKEREACAQVCDDMMRSYWNTADDEGPDPDDCAKAIRARGEASIRRQS